MTLEEVKELSYEEIRIKVAELLGWTRIHLDSDWQGVEEYTRSTVVGIPKNCVFIGSASYDETPNYPEDLNACYEMEERCYESPEEWEAYGDHLMDCVVRDSGYQGADLLIHATARQRCEAFIMVMEAVNVKECE